MDLGARIYVAGHRGLVGAAVVEVLRAQGYVNILYGAHAEMDFLDSRAVDDLLFAERPEFVFLTAERAGGIIANQTYPATFIRENLAIGMNVIEASRKAGVRRLLLVGSSCVYPRLAPQPIPESCLMRGFLEPTSRPYAVAKIAAIEMCWNYNRQFGPRYLAVIPAKVYGPWDNFDLQTSHVLPALIRKAAEAKLRREPELIVWGSGAPRREFIYSVDLAEACVFLMNLNEDRFAALTAPDEPPLINLGSGEEVTIRGLAQAIARVMGYQGKLRFDLAKPDGAPRRLLDSQKMHELGWHHGTGLEEGILRTCQWYLRANEMEIPRG